MVNVLLKKQLLEIFSAATIYDAKKNRARSKAATILLLSSCSRC